MNLLFWLLLLVVLLFVTGGAVIGWGIWLLWYALIGLVLGGFARLLVSNTGGLGVFATILAGLVGSFGGGAIAYALDLSWFVSLLISILVAAIAIAVLSAGSRD